MRNARLSAFEIRITVDPRDRPLLRTVLQAAIGRHARARIRLIDADALDGHSVRFIAVAPTIESVRAVTAAAGLVNVDLSRLVRSDDLDPRGGPS